MIMVLQTPPPQKKNNKKKKKKKTNQKKQNKTNFNPIEIYEGHDIFGFNGVQNLHVDINTSDISTPELSVERYLCFIIFMKYGGKKIFFNFHFAHKFFRKVLSSL